MTKWLGLALLLFQGLSMEPGEMQHVTPLSFDAREFRNAFNATSDRTRVVLVFSPT